MAAPPTAAPTAPTLSIDVLHDLDSASSLLSQLTSDRDAVFNLGGDVVKFATGSVKDAAVAKAATAIAINAPASWTLPNGIVFSLSGRAKCAMCISTVSETFAVATTLDATTPSKILAGPKAGMAYINIDLDFDIKASAKASGSVGGVGIAGAVSGGRCATLSFCQPVDDSLNAMDAIKLAFSQIVFPLDPTRITEMQTGSLCRVLFDGTFSAELDVTYGIGSHTFAAPGVASALASAQKAVSITPPSPGMDAGVTGSVCYSHTDHFGLVVDKSTDSVATVYLIRALENDIGVTAGIDVGITASDASISIRQDDVQKIVKEVTHSDKLAAEAGSAAGSAGNSLASSLNAKLASWAEDPSSQVGLSASLCRQQNHTTLFVFDADLSNPALTSAGWPALISGDIFKALNQGGLTLQPGSGVSESLKRSCTISFHFFNLFNFSDVNDFFSNANVELGPDGTIRIHAAVGDETKAGTKTSFDSFRVYFVVGAIRDAAGNVSHTDVDLRLELCEASRQRSGASFSDTLAIAPALPATAAMQKAIASYLGGHPGGKLTLTYQIKSPVYEKLTFTPFNGGNPGPLPQSADQNNWNAFRSATTELIPDLSILSAYTYDNWVAFNRAAIDEIGSTIDPNRRQTGVIAQGLKALPDDNNRISAGYFMQASQGFMNLVEDLTNLASAAEAVTDLTRYNELLAFVAQVITSDVFIPYGVPTAGALLKLCGASTTQVAGDVQRSTDNSSMNCTLTLS
jgi:hypothetical protein